MAMSIWLTSLPCLAALLLLVAIQLATVRSQESIFSNLPFGRKLFGQTFASKFWTKFNKKNIPK
jgi:hypothetical protein